MRYLLLFTFFVIIQYPCYSQVYRGIDKIKPYEKDLAELDMYLQLNPDQSEEIYHRLLPKAIKTKNKSLETVLYIYNGTIHYYEGHRDSAKVYFEKAINLAEEIKSKQLLSTAKIRKLFVIADNSDSKIIVQLMQDEYDIAKENGDTLNMIYSLNGIAMNYQNLDKTEESVANYMKAMKLAQENNNQFEYGFLLNNLGLVKLRLKSSEDAYKDFMEGIRIAKKLKNVRLELTLRENLGYYYMDVDSLELAEKEYKDAYNLANDLGYTYLAFNSVVNLGVMERTRGNYEKSDSLLNQALKMAHIHKLYYAISPIYLTQAQIELHRENYTKVPALLDSGLYYAKFTSTNEIKEGILLITERMYEKRGDFKNALKYYKELSHFRDSIDKNGQMEIVKELHLKYDVEREEKKRMEQQSAYEAEISKEKLNSARLRQNIGVGILIVILIIGGLIIYYFKEKHKREAEFSSALVNKLEEERGRIARDLHDGLGQSLVILKNKFNKLDLPEDNETESINSGFTQTIEDVRMISRSLIPPELRRLGLSKAIQKMMKDVESATGIVITTDLDYLESLELNEAQEIRIYRIIQELTNNTLKHSEATSLKVEFIGDTSEFKIIFQDNGKGISAEVFNSPQNSVGLRSIEQRLKYLKGSIKFEKQNKGFKAIIRIKLKN